MTMRHLYLTTMAVAGLIVLASPAHAQGPAGLYKAKCQVCHGPDGKGNTPAGVKLKVPDFHSPEVATMSDSAFTAAIKNGKGKMQAYSAQLTAAQITSLVKYIRSLIAIG